MKAIQQDERGQVRAMPASLRAVPWAGAPRRSADWWVVAISLAAGAVALVGTAVGWL